MPFNLPIPEPWKSRGWRLKIQDKERNEEPHVTILRRTEKWRFGLRSLAFLDSSPNPREVPSELIEHVLARLADCRSEWDRLYPRNPVVSLEDEHDKDD